MKKRIKTIYILTSIALALLFVVQGVWLISQWKYIIDEYEGTIIKITSEVVDKEFQLRDNLYSKSPNKEPVPISTTRIETKNGTTTTTLKLYYIDSIKRNRFDESMLMDSALLEKYAYESFTFSDIKDIDIDEIYNAQNKFRLNRAIPFDIAMVDSLLNDRGVSATLSRIKIDSTAWRLKSSSNNSLLSPRYFIEIPYNNLQGELLRLECGVPISFILATMGSMLILSMIMSLLVIASFILQIKTIRRQRKVDEVRRDFLHTMIHELKRPISTLKMCVSSLRNERLMQNNDFKEEVLQNSYKELDNLSSYFAKLRDVTMADSGAIPLNITKIELSTLIEELIPRISIPSSKRVSFDIKTCETVSINADNLHLQNILHNLIENSIKYSEEEVTIALSYYTDDSFLVIEVSDNGGGISPSDLPHIFDKFYRGRNLNSTSGIGLGLSYVKMLMEAHRGVISVESTLNVGTKFTVKLPL